MLFNTREGRRREGSDVDVKKKRVSSFEEKYLLEAQRRKRHRRSKRVPSFEERYLLEAQRGFEWWINS